MDTSIFIARLIGPVLIVVAIVVWFQPQRIATMVREILDGDAILFLSGMQALVLGLVLVNTHNLWVSDWRVIITIFGWLCVFAGVFRLLAPQALKSLAAKMLNAPRLMRIEAICAGIIGVAMSALGYSG